MRNYNKRNIGIYLFFFGGIFIIILGLRFIENERIYQFMLITWIIGLIPISIKPIIKRLYLILFQQGSWSIFDLPIWYENDVDMITRELKEKGYQSIQIIGYNQRTTAWKKIFIYEVRYIDLSHLNHLVSIEVGFWHGISIFNDRIIDP